MPARDPLGTQTHIAHASCNSLLSFVQTSSLPVRRFDFHFAHVQTCQSTPFAVPARLEFDLAALPSSVLGIVGHLASEMNPTNTPSELICRENPADASCVTNTDGAWNATSSNVGGDVGQWGDGHILTDPADQTVTIRTPVEATDPSVAYHGPPCALPGSQVVPVETTFYIEVSSTQHELKPRMYLTTMLFRLMCVRSSQS